MSGDAQCDEIRVLLPELALGIADGEDRSRALEHAATCADCRRELESLSTVADELLELAPAAEPPAGFETRVLGALHPDRRRARRTFRRPFAFAAVALATAAMTAGITVRAFEGDRSLADHYRSVLAEAHGSYFSAARLRDAAGAEGGTVFLYQGAPWSARDHGQPAVRSLGGPRRDRDARRPTAAARLVRPRRGDLGRRRAGRSRRRLASPAARPRGPCRPRDAGAGARRLTAHGRAIRSSSGATRRGSC